LDLRRFFGFGFFIARDMAVAQSPRPSSASALMIFPGISTLFV
jgi:hypothetical protein